MKIKYTGTEKNVDKILTNLPGGTKAIRANHNSITIPTKLGAKQVFKGETIVINGEDVTIIEK